MLKIVIKFLIRLVIMAFVILGLAHLIPGIEVPTYPEALIFALVLAICNAVIAPILLIISFPITVLTVGLFALVVNAFTFWLAAQFSYGIHILTFWAAFWGGLITWAASFCLNEWLSD